MSNPFSKKNHSGFHLGKGPAKLVGEDGAAEAVVEQGTEIVGTRALLPEPPVLTQSWLPVHLYQ